ncbi:universal stress protein [Streptomyces echinoruber]|uniref:UspA domain-containing protein n=1 Tax=Streptomyces echinoruber TaxID=68898 RepID=A0A918VHA4_9ACTN|nr:universal stress protein [Streptomyces echinoruber]GGZ96153.1 hypothetical protein GCM10010389_39250 [Streptomyces echinoruber]
MLHNVAVGIDGSAESLAAAHWAAREALRRGAGLTVVHAWWRRVRPGPDVPAATGEHDRAEQTLREAVDGVRAAHPELSVTGRLICDATVSALLTAAAGTDLLVLGSSGPGGVAGCVTGSVSRRVAGRSPCPVVLVGAGQGTVSEHLLATDGIAPDEIPEIPYRAVLLGLDTGHPCDELIAFAFEAARRRGTELRVLHACRPPSGSVADTASVSRPSGPERPAAAEHAVLAAVRPWREKYPEVPVTESVVEGRATTELVRAAAEAGLAVVGRRTRGGRIGTHLGPVAHAVLHHVRCPVAVVPHS